MRKMVEGALASMALAAFIVAAVSTPTHAATGVAPKGDCLLLIQKTGNVIKSCNTSGTCSPTVACSHVESSAIGADGKEYITGCSLIPC